MKVLVGAFNQEKALVGAFSVITNLRMDLFQALVQVVMDPDSVRCPPPYNPDYLGWIMGKWGVNK